MDLIGLVMAEYNWIVLAGRGFFFSSGGGYNPTTSLIRNMPSTNGFWLQSGDVLWFIPVVLHSPDRQARRLIREMRFSIILRHSPELVHSGETIE